MFGQGIILSLLSGIVLFFIGVIGKDVYFSYLNLSETTAKWASDYYLFYQFVFLLLPVYTVLLELVYSDGDSLICNISSIVQIGANIIVSVWLCFRIGIMGVGIGTFIGIALSVAVLLIHFLRKQNNLKFVWHLSPKDIGKVLKCGITDSTAYLCIGFTSFVATKFVIYMFSEYYLPVLLVVFNIIELTIVFDGIGQAITPLVNVYRGEENTVGIKRIMKTSLFYAIAEGLLMSLIMLFFGGTIAKFFGLSENNLIEIGKLAARLISPFFFCTGVLFLLTTYYMIIEKVFLATVITVIKDFAVPSAFMCIFGMLLGINGVWIGLGVAPFASIIVVLLFIYLRYGRKKFPLLLEQETKNIQIFDIELSVENVMKLRDSVAAYLTENNVNSASVNRIMFLIEETCMSIYENNKQRKVSMECSVMIDSEIQMIIRDDGCVRDITDSDARITSFRTYVLSQLMTRTPDNQNLVTTGYNRNVFRFKK